MPQLSTSDGSELTGVHLYQTVSPAISEIKLIMALKVDKEISHKSRENLKMSDYKLPSVLCTLHRQIGRKMAAGYKSLQHDHKTHKWPEKEGIMDWIRLQIIVKMAK